MADIPAWTPASKALARELRGYGFSFTGPVTAYATFQACGVVDDHLRDCVRRGAARGGADPGALSIPVYDSYRACHTVTGQYGRCHDRGTRSRAASQAGQR